MIDLQWDRDFALEQSGDDQELLAELLALLETSSLQEFARMRMAHEEGDAAKMGEAAHSIKGAAASLGVGKLQEVAWEMEEAGRHGDLAVASSLLSPLERTISALTILK
ncbi:MAG: Hpt domain-containing protein [Desulfurivibrionaceae bacterium]|nr:Hpt domain-containing protein [Desulfurivibrionaceae bacterium]